MKSSWRKGNWSTLVPTMGVALWVCITLTYVWDAADHGRLIVLIWLSVIVGIGLGQLPPIRFLLRRHEPDGVPPASETRPRT